MEPLLQATMITQAAFFGINAHQNNQKCLPYRDAKLMGLIAGQQQYNEFGFSAPIMAAWIEAWTSENLK